MRLSKILSYAGAVLLAFVACTDRNANPPINIAAYAAAATPCAYAASPPETTTVVQIHGDEQALPCRFMWRKILTLDNPSFDVDAALATVLQNSRGEYIVRGRNNIIGLLDSTGKLIRTFGRDGGGPGEFRFATVVATDALDTVYVYDPYQKRLTVISPTLSAFVRTVNTPALSFEHSFLALPSSQLLVGGYSDTTLNTLRILGTDGIIQRAWNVDTMTANRAERNRIRGTRELPGNRDRVMTRWLASNSDGGVLVAWRNSYIIENWTSTFQLARTFKRTVAWFPTLNQDQFPGAITDSTPAQIYGVGTDSGTGNVVVKILVTARKWKAPANGTTTAEGTASSQPVAVGDATNYLDTVFDAFDPRTGQLTASARLPGTFGAVNNGLRFQTLRELPNGDVVVDIIQFVLAARGNP